MEKQGSIAHAWLMGYTYPHEINAQVVGQTEDVSKYDSDIEDIIESITFED